MAPDYDGTPLYLITRTHLVRADSAVAVGTDDGWFPYNACLRGATLTTREARRSDLEAHTIPDPGGWITEETP